MPLLPAPGFRNAVCLVTGGAGGIGAALAEALAERGARVLIADRKAEEGEALASSLRARGFDAHFFYLEVTSSTGWEALQRFTFSTFSHLDFLFNNAGIGVAGSVLDTPWEDWDRAIAVNVGGVIHGVRTFYPAMASRGSGHIVNVASGAGLCPRPGMVPYATTKHAVVGLSLSLREEARDHGVKVSAVCPGYIATGILHSTPYRGLDGEALARAIPIPPLSAAACAFATLEGVRRNRAIIPISALTRLEWWLHRLSPSLGLLLARQRWTQMKRHRLPPPAPSR